MVVLLHELLSHLWWSDGVESSKGTAGGGGAGGGGGGGMYRRVIFVNFELLCLCILLMVVLLSEISSHVLWTVRSGSKKGNTVGGVEEGGGQECNVYVSNLCQY